MEVQDIMRKIVVVDENTTLKEASNVMSKKAIGSLVVVKGEKLVGIVTERDIMRNVSKLSEKISEIMSKDVKTIDAGEEVSEAANHMAKSGIKRLPVTSKGKLVGIITATDIIAHSSEIGESFMIN